MIPFLIPAITLQASVANTPFSSTTSALTRYTPPSRAGVASDGTCPTAVPRKFQAKPVKRVALIHSHPAQRTGSAKRPQRPQRRHTRAAIQP